MAEINVGGQVYEYGELSIGKNRGITFHRKGIRNDQHEYKFNPNPHDDPWYNKSQGKFYAEAASQIANIVSATGNYPAFGAQTTVHGIAYTLDEP